VGWRVGIVAIDYGQVAAIMLVITQGWRSGDDYTMRLCEGDFIRVFIGVWACKRDGCGVGS
jgi:hypothetical protein